MDTPDKGIGVRFFGERFPVEMVDGMFAGGDRRFFGSDKSPVFLIIGSLFDPAFEDFNLFRREVFVGLGRRHDFVRVL